MTIFPSDVFTEPKDVDPDTLANLGPLGLLVRDQPTVRQGIEAWIQNRKLHTDSVSLRVEEHDALYPANRSVGRAGVSRPRRRSSRASTMAALMAFQRTPAAKAAR